VGRRRWSSNDDHITFDTAPTRQRQSRRITLKDKGRKDIEHLRRLYAKLTSLPTIHFGKKHGQRNQESQNLDSTPRQEREAHFLQYITVHNTFDFGHLATEFRAGATPNPGYGCGYDDTFGREILKAFHRR